MLRPADFQSEFHTLVEEDLEGALSFLERRVSSPDSKRKNIVELKHQLNALRQDHKRGLIDRDSYLQGRQEIRQAGVYLASKLSKAHFKPQPGQGAYRQKGAILYWIAEEMQLGQLTSCIVRLSDGRDKLAGRGLRSGKKDKAEFVSVSEIMEVCLDDAEPSGAFEVHSHFYKEQFQSKEKYAVWNFRVKPIREGTHRLKLTVSLLEMAAGEERRRNIELEKTVVVGSRVPPPDKQGKFVPAGVALRYNSYVAQPFLAKRALASSKPAVKRQFRLRPLIGKLNALHLLGLALVLAILGWFISRMPFADWFAFAGPPEKEAIAAPAQSDQKKDTLLRDDLPDGEGSLQATSPPPDPDLPTPAPEKDRQIVVDDVPADTLVPKGEAPTTVARTEARPFVLPQVRLFIDPRDNEKYRVILIDDQWWLAENIDYQVESASIDVLKGRQGKFYTAGGALEACPPGWKLPTGPEWRELLTVIPFAELQNLLATPQSGEADYVAEAYHSLLAGWVLKRMHYGLGESGNYWYAAGDGNVQSIEISYPHRPGFFSMQGVSNVILPKDADKLLLPCRCVYKGEAPLDAFGPVSMGR